MKTYIKFKSAHTWRNAYGQDITVWCISCINSITSSNKCQCQIDNTDHPRHDRCENWTCNTPLSLAGIPPKAPVPLKPHDYIRWIGKNYNKVSMDPAINSPYRFWLSLTEKEREEYTLRNEKDGRKLLNSIILND